MDDLVRNGGIRFAPGFRFQPTDEELILQYLKKKVFSCPLPSSVISEIELYKYDPWDLPGDSGEEKYFFNIQETKCPNANRHNKITHSGYWKATGSEKQIVACRSQQVVGKKKVFVFYKGKHSNASKTEWIMHEYCLLDAESRACIFPQRKNSTQNFIKQMEWVVCRIFAKRRSSANGAIIQPSNNLKKPVATEGLIDFMAQQMTDMGSTSFSSSSDLSCITELSSSSGCVNEETSSA